MKTCEIKFRKRIDRWAMAVFIKNEPRHDSFYYVQLSILMGKLGGLFCQFPATPPSTLSVLSAQ